MSVVMRAACALVLCLAAGIVAAQPAPWAEALPVVVTEHSGAALVEHQVLLTIDTQALIGAGRMRADAADLRFALDQAGTQPIPHWTESGVGTPNTRVWLRMPALLASADTGAFMFIGNPAAATTSTITVLDYDSDALNTGTQQTANTSLSGVPDSQRGYRFSVNEDLLMVGVGKNTPSGNPRIVTLFDAASTNVLEQMAVSGAAAQWSYQPLAQPRWLVPGNQYVLEIFNPAGDDAYYYAAPPTMSPRVNYLDMRYCNGCTANTFPTNYLGGMLYGYVDFQFRTRKQATPQPTAALGAAASQTALAADANPAGFASTVNLTATIASAFETGGTVTFVVDGTTACTVAVAAGSAGCALNGLAVGTYAVEATYSGNEFVLGSSDTLSLVVQPVVPGAPTAVTATAGDDSATVAFTAPVFDGGNTPLAFTARCADGVATGEASGASSPIVVTGLVNGTTYQCTVFASNSAGDGPQSEAATVVPLGPADAPTGVVATPGDGEAAIAFVAPVDTGGSPITGYAAACHVGPTTHTVNGVASPIIVGGLTNGVTYSCTVAAITSYGTGLASNAVDVMPLTVPGAPTAITATRGNAQAVIGFAPPADSGGTPVIDYTATCSDGVASFSATAAAPPITVTGLTNGTSYACSVRARTSGGLGPASATATVVPATVPGAPTGVTAASGDAQAVVSFSAPASDGGDAIDQYTVRCTDGGTPVEASAAASPITIAPLVNATTYTCTVTASNDLGEGPASAPATVVPRTVPGAPTALVATHGNAQATLAFVAPASSGGSAIIDYTANCTDGIATFTATGAASPLTVTGLTNGTSYTCTVSARNDEGAGPASAPATVVPRTVPGAPTALVATRGDAQATLAFAPPASTGGSAILDYTASCTDGVATFTATGAASPLTVTGLVNGTGYTCTARARNGEGTGPASASASVVPAALPGAPTAVTVTPADGQLVVAFTAPAASGGSAITGYTVRCTGANGTIVATGAASPITVSGLANGTSYSCTVAANNALGEGAASGAAQGTPQGGATNARLETIPALGRDGLAWLVLAMAVLTFALRRRLV